MACENVGSTENRRTIESTSVGKHSQNLDILDDLEIQTRVCQGIKRLSAALIAPAFEFGCILNGQIKWPDSAEEIQS